MSETESEAGPSKPRSPSHSQAEFSGIDDEEFSNAGASDNGEGEDLTEGEEDLPSVNGAIVKPLTSEELARYKAEQERTGVIYISRIPPGMRPTKVRHFMSAYGEIGKVYLQQEDAKRAYLRKKYTSTKKAHYTEGWVEFKDKRVARAVADMLNGQPIGGKKGTRFRDDVWTMKYLPKFKWYMLTEQVAHEAAIHTARLRVELTQSRSEQQDYLKQVELARVLGKRAKKKEEKGEKFITRDVNMKRCSKEDSDRPKKKRHTEAHNKQADNARDGDMKEVLAGIF